MIPKQVTTFLESLTGRSPETIQNYTSFANVLFGYVQKPVKDLTVQDIMSFLKWGVEKQHWTLSTMRQYAQVAYRFMGEWKDEEFLKELTKQIRMLPKIRKYAHLYEGVYIPSDKIDAFINATPNEEYAVCATMILKWGFRLSEALGQTLEDINPKLLRVIARGKGGGFEHKARPVWVDRASLQRVLNFAGCTATEVNGAEQIRKKGKIINLSPRSVEFAWKKAAKKIGLPYWNKLTPHDGRHSYAIDFIIKRKKEGMAALVLLKNQLGHSNINTTLIYLDIAGTEAREVFDAGIQE